MLLAGGHSTKTTRYVDVINSAAFVGDRVLSAVTAVTLTHAALALGTALHSWGLMLPKK